jgi:hypothetical protein
MIADWMVRRREILNPALRQRVIDLVDAAVANARPGQTGTDIDDGITHTSVWWSWRQDGDTSAQKTVHPTGYDYTIDVEAENEVDEIAGPWVFVTTRDSDQRVLWMPGMGFEDVDRFLDWFEAES